MGDRIKSVRDLEVYKLVFDCAMKIFEITKIFTGRARGLGDTKMGSYEDKRMGR